MTQIKDRKSNYRKKKKTSAEKKKTFECIDLPFRPSERHIELGDRLAATQPRGYTIRLMGFGGKC